MSQFMNGMERSKGWDAAEKAVSDWLARFQQQTACSINLLSDLTCKVLPIDPLESTMTSIAVVQHERPILEVAETQIPNLTQDLNPALVHDSDQQSQFVWTELETTIDKPTEYHYDDALPQSEDIWEILNSPHLPWEILLDAHTSEAV